LVAYNNLKNLLITKQTKTLKIQDLNKTLILHMMRTIEERTVKR